MIIIVEYNDLIIIRARTREYWRSSVVFEGSSKGTQPNKENPKNSFNVRLINQCSKIKNFQWSV